MKYFLLIAFSITIYSCSNRKNTDKDLSSIPKEYLTPLLDSFNSRKLDDEPSLQYDIALDTFESKSDFKYPRIYAVLPKLAEADNPFVNKQIDKLMKDKRADFNKKIAELGIEKDSSWRNRRWDIWIRPMSLYQTDKAISFSLQTNREYLGMSTSFEYDVINYDLENKKSILLKDYFILNTPVDISFLEKIISRAAEIDFSIKHTAEMGEHINFSFDDNYVYFYFDKYGLAWGTRSVKKKYILDHINPVYRDK